MSEPAEPLATIAAQNPLALLQNMIEKGTDPDALKKMMDLAERWQQNAAEAAFKFAMTKCQAEMPNVVRDAHNSHTNSRYATLETVNQQVKPIYTKHGFSVSYGEGEAKEGLRRIVADINHEAGHTKQYHLDLAQDGIGVKGNANMTPVQGMGSTVAYARRYLLCMIFNITVADEDNDGQDTRRTQGLNDDQTVTLNELLADCQEKLGKAKYDNWLPRFYKWVGELQRMDKPIADLNDVHAAHFGAIKMYLDDVVRGKK